MIDLAVSRCISESLNDSEIQRSRWISESLNELHGYVRPLRHRLAGPSHPACWARRRRGTSGEGARRRGRGLSSDGARSRLHAGTTAPHARTAQKQRQKQRQQQQQKQQTAASLLSCCVCAAAALLRRYCVAAVSLLRCCVGIASLLRRCCVAASLLRCHDLPWNGRVPLRPLPVIEGAREHQ